MSGRCAPPPSASVAYGKNPFGVAYNTVENVYSFVTDRISDARDTSQSLIEVATGTIGALGDVNLDFDVGNPPVLPVLDPSVDLSINLPEITPTSFGEITSNLPTAPSLDTLPDVDALNIPEFTPSITGLSIPEPPTDSAPVDAPDRPALGTVTLPTAPTVTLPNIPDMESITVPDFAGLTLPNFEADLPEFEATAVNAVLQWSEPQYQPEIIDEVITQIRRLWDGGSGLPPLVEQAIVERAMDREDLISEREIAAVAEEFSKRGFTMPTGMQAKRVDQMREDLAVKKLGLQRELTIEFAKWQIENVRFAIEQGIAAENVFVNIFTNAAARAFEAAKYHVEAQLSMYNAQVALFNSRMQAYQIRAQVFDTLVKSELAKIEVFKAEVEAELAKGQVNEQRVKTYTATVQALQSRIEIFRAQMEGAKVESDIIRNDIEVYKADVQAYAERVRADKTKYEAYEARVRGEVAKGGIIDAEARAYAALVSGKASAADIDVKRADLVIQKNRSLIQGYIASLDAEKIRVQSQSAVIQAGAQAYSADTQRYVAQAQAETAKANVEVAIKETEMRTNLAYYEAQVQAYITKMEQMMRKAAITLDSLKAAGSLTSTLAAGAMAGVHVGANVSGSGGVAASGQISSSTSSSSQNSTSCSTSYNYDGGSL